MPVKISPLISIPLIHSFNQLANHSINCLSFC